MTPGDCESIDGAGSWVPMVWETATDCLALSPADGGRVLSWRHRGGPELVCPPQGLDGGLARVLLAEERFPGYSYGTPHIVLAQTATSTGFRAHNGLGGAVGWSESLAAVPERIFPRKGFLLRRTCYATDLRWT